MKRFLLTLIVLASVAWPTGTSSLGGDQDKGTQKKEASAWMKSKIQLSQDLLLGLTEADFDKISRNAKGLNLINFLEGWVRADRADYRQQVQLFAAANQELIRQAEAKNLYGATLAYNQLTVSCVQCHRIVRDVQKK